MQNKESNPSTKLDASKKVAICIPQSDDDDLLLATKILYKYILGKGKEAGVLVGGEITEKQKKLFEGDEIPFKQDSNPVSYVVSIDYGRTGLEKVTYDIDEKTGKLNFHLIPTQGEFDFNDVEYKKEGNDFDLTITMGVVSFKELGKLYEGNKYLFTDNEVISIFKGSGSLGEYTITVPDGASIIYGVRTFIGDQIDSDTANTILQSLVQSEPLLEGAPRESFITEVQELVSTGADWHAALKKGYYNKDYINLELQIKLMHNILVDRDSGVIWSKVNNEEVKFTGIDESTFDPSGRIVFNISSEFDLAFAVYELKKDKLHVIVESNDTEKYSAENIASIFGGSGDSYHGSFVVENMPVRDFEKKVFLVLSDMYGIDVYGTAAKFRGATVKDEKNTGSK